MTTHIVFILDRSGSMHALETDVRGGFNSYIKKQKKLKEDGTKLTTILFDDRYEVIHDKLPLKNIGKLTNKEYFVRGSTALLDAIGKAITSMVASTKKTDKVLFFINTDGYENASAEFTGKDIKALVKKQKKQRKWEFVFLGANIDSFTTGNMLGVTINADYTANTLGVKSVYATMSGISTDFRQTGQISKDALDDIV